MKLAEALQERADLNCKIEELRKRINLSLLVQEGEEPPEEPSELIEELEASCARLTELISAINITNCSVKADGMTLTEIIAKKDILSLRCSAYRDMVHTASQSVYRARGTEIRIVPMIRAAELQKSADAAAKEIRRLDNLLQATNWSTELIEK